MTPAEKLALARALDCLWGGLEACNDILQETLDSQDGRLEQLREATSKGQDAVQELHELFGIEK
jgi:hypothetical protein